MLITNLTDNEFEFPVDTRFVEKCINKSEHIIPHELDMFAGMMAHRNKSNILNFYENDSMHGLNIIKQVPIFLVTRNDCLKTFKVGYFGHTSDVIVPLDKLPNELPSDEKDWNISDTDNPKVNDDIFDGVLKLKELESISCIDLLGIYTRTYPLGRYCGIEESNPQIFIWVDKIWDYVKGDRHLYKVLATQVILHELAHAMMDINLTGYYHKQTFPPAFYTLKEESLANALSLSMIKSHISTQDWNFLVNFVKKQPFQYALGLDYVDDRGGHLVCRSSGEWIHLKECGSYSIEVVKHWIKYIQGQRPLNLYELEHLDQGMWWPDGLYLYDSKYYSNHDVCVKVIKDYAKQKGANVSRADMHNAFPDTLNDYFESIIDYPEIQEFHYKEDSHSRPIFEENIIECSDGKIAICDYWHPNSMDAFVNNANRLGIIITTFKK